MTERVAILGAVRTPLAKVAPGGNAFSAVSGVDLLVAVIEAVLERTGFPATSVDQVISGVCFQRHHPHNPARVAAMKAGLPDRVAGVTVHQNCASGQAAFMQACRQILLGESRGVIAGGMEKMDILAQEEIDAAFFDPVCGLSMPQTADLLFRDFGLTREEQDRFSHASHQRALAARERFKTEIVPVAGLDHDTGVRDQPLEKHLRLVERLYRTHLAPGTENITPASSCQNTDGAAALLLAPERVAREAGVEPRAFVRAFATLGVDPRRMGLGPVAAIRLALERAGWEQSSVDLFEINEAFAAQYLACERELGLDRERVNPCGGAIALGHPVGCTGARLLVTLLHEMERRGARRGAASLCVGGGQGSAVLIEREAPG